MSASSAVSLFFIYIALLVIAMNSCSMKDSMRDISNSLESMERKTDGN